MAKTQLTKNSTTGNWELNETDQGQTYSNTLETAGKAIDGDIKISIGVKSGSVSASAAKGTVSNHSVIITPSATKTEGYISGGTTTGTGVTVSVSELVSGTYTVSTTGSSIDVTNYKYIKVDAGTATPNVSPTGSAIGTIYRGNQIKIGKGYYSSDEYYIAQSNSGTKSISSNGTHSCDGYSNVSVNVPQEILYTNSDRTSFYYKTDANPIIFVRNTGYGSITVTVSCGSNNTSFSISGINNGAIIFVNQNRQLVYRLWTSSSTTVLFSALFSDDRIEVSGGGSKTSLFPDLY